MNPGMGQFGGYPYMMYPPVNKKVIINPTTKKPINYRTVPCKNFHSADGCSRGDNCHFIHDYAQAGKQIQNFQEWKNKNEVRQQNLLQMQNLMQKQPRITLSLGPSRMIQMPKKRIDEKLDAKIITILSFLVKINLVPKKTFQITILYSF